MRNTWTQSRVSIAVSFPTLEFTAASTSSLLTAMGLVHILKFYSALTMLNLIALCIFYYVIIVAFGRTSVLRCCWLGGRKGILPVKTWVVGYWHGCLERDADLHMAQLMPLPLTVSCFSKIQIGFTFLVPAHPGGPGKRAIKRVCVWVGVIIVLWDPVQLLEPRRIFHLYCNP